MREELSTHLELIFFFFLKRIFFEGAKFKVERI